MKIQTITRRLSACALGAMASCFIATSAHAQLAVAPSGAITVNDNSTATPYPSSIIVKDAVGTIEKVTVTLNKVTHNYPDDLDILLVGPNGEQIVLMSDVGLDGALNGVDITLDDGASQTLPDSSQIVTGSYKPTDVSEPGQPDVYPDVVTFSAAGPTSLAALKTHSPNGTWNLYVVDDTVITAGSIASWSLKIYTTPTIVGATFGSAAVSGSNPVKTDEDTAASFTVSLRDDSTPGAGLSLSAVSNNTDLVPNNTDTVTGFEFSGTGTTRTVTIHPKAQAHGTGSITVTVKDELGGTATIDIPIQINAVNDAPTIALSTPTAETVQGVATSTYVTVAGNPPVSTSHPIQATLTDPDIDSGDESAANLVLSVSNSSDSTVIAPSDVFFTGSGLVRGITIAPHGAAGAVSKTVTLTITVTDKRDITDVPNLTASTTLDVTVDPVKYGVFGNPAAITVADAGTASSQVSVSGISGLVGNLTVTLADANMAIPEDWDVVLTGPHGQSTHLMKANGGNNALSHARLTFDDSTATGAAPLPDDSAIQTGPNLFSTYQTHDHTLGGLGLNAFSGTDAAGTWTLSVTDASPGNGTSGTILGGFVLNIFPAPIFSPAFGPLTIGEDSGTQTISTPVSDFDGKVASVTASSDDPTLATATAALNTDHNQVTVSITPKPNAPLPGQNGSTTIRVTITDDSGFTTQSAFVLTITPDNDAPTISVIQKQITTAGTPVGPLPFTVSDIETPGGGTLKVSVSSDNTKLLPNGNIFLNGSGQNYSITLYPAVTQNSPSTIETANITISVTDVPTDTTKPKTTTETFALTVTPEGANLFPQPQPITINDNAKADPFPSTITVGNLLGKVGEVKVTLAGITHPIANEIDVLLVGPNQTTAADSGHQVVLMSDAGGTFSLNNAQIILSEDALTDLPFNTAITQTDENAGQYRPANYDGPEGPADDFKTAPVGSRTSNLNSFIGDTANGDWRLYVVDDTAGTGGNKTVGSINGGWVLSIRTQPALQHIDDQATKEDNNLSVKIVVGDDNSAANFTVSASSDNKTLLPDDSDTSDDTGSFQVTGTGGTRTLIIKPALNQNTGTPAVPATVTVTVSDGANTSSQHFLLTVSPQNDLPVITGLADHYDTLQATPIGPITFTVSDVETTNPSLLTIDSVTSDTPAVVPSGNITISGTGATRTLTIVPAGIQTGHATITLVLSDGTDKHPYSFVVNVNQTLAFASGDTITINDDGVATPYPSTITTKGINGKISKVTAILNGFSHPFPEDVDVLLVSPDRQTVMLMSDAGGGNAVSGLRLTFSDDSANPVVPDTSMLMSGNYRPFNWPGGTPDDDINMPQGAKVSPPSGPYGTTLENLNAGNTPNGDWNLFVRDDTFPDSGSISGGWILLFETAPAFSDLPAVTINEDSQLVVPFNVSDSDTTPDHLTVSFSIDESSPSTPAKTAGLFVLDAAHKNDKALVYDKTTGTGTLTLNPTADLNGVNAITMTVTDSSGNTTTKTFNVTVTPVDDAPVVTVDNKTVNTPEDTAVSVVFHMSDIDSDLSAAASVVSISSSGSPIPRANITTTRSNNDVTAVLTPLPNATGQTIVHYTVTDGTLVGSVDVTVNVTPVNDAPTITPTPIPNPPSVKPGESTGIIAFTIGDVETPTKSLNVSAVSSNPNVVPASNLILRGSDANRSIEATTIGGSEGQSTTITITVTDDGTPSIGSPADSGKTLSATTSFTVTVLTSSSSTFSRTTPITILDKNGTDSRPADPYPSTISISNSDLRGPVNSVSVVLDGFKHDSPDDVDVLLVAPNGHGVTLLSDTGGANSVSNLRLIFQDGAIRLADDAPLVSGTYSPSNFEGVDSFPGAPAGPYGSALSDFKGINPIGDWKLYVVDDTTGSAGEIAFGWSLIIDVNPSITVTPDSVEWNEDTTKPISVLVDDFKGPSSGLVVHFDSSNPSVLPAPADIVHPGSSTIPVTLIPAANQNGSGTLKVTVTRTTDNGQSSFSLPFKIDPVDDVPTISRLTSKSTPEGTKLSVDLSVEDVDTSTSLLEVKATSSDQTIVKDSNLILDNRSNDIIGFTSDPLPFSILPEPLKPGPTTITVTVWELKDLGASADPRFVRDTSVPAQSSQFTLTVTAINHSPEITIAPTATTPTGVPITIPFTVADSDVPPQTITVKASSDKPELVPNSTANILVTPESGPAGSRTLTLTPVSGITGVQTVNITLTVTDNGGTIPPTTAHVILTIGPTRERIFTNGGKPIVINDHGPASPYPSTIEVSASDLIANISKVTVVLNKFNHTFPGDVDMLLVGPGGISAAKKVVLMSDAGANTHATDFTITFDQSDLFPDIPVGTFTSGTYRPHNYEGTGDTFSPDAGLPAGPYDSSNLDDFNGTSPTGTWSLYVMDDTPSDSGSINGGWELHITTKPSLEGLHAITVDEDQTVSEDFTVKEEAFAPQDFDFTTVKPTSNNHALIKDENIHITGSGNKFTVTAQPEPHTSGTADITITMFDEAGQQVVTAFNVKVNAVNNPPTIDQVPPIQIAAGTMIVTTINYGDVDSSNLHLDIQSSDTSVIPLNNISIIGNELRIASQGTTTGTSRITVTVTDDGTPPKSSAPMTFVVTVTPPTNPLFSNADRGVPQSIIISDDTQANPYPSTIHVTGVQGTILKVSVTLVDVTHNFPDDIDLLLVGPVKDGKSVVLMSDAGGGIPLNHGRLTFDDVTGVDLPDNTALNPLGVYKTKNFGGDTDPFVAPAPAGPYGAGLSVFNGSSANGDWSLYVVDDTSPDAGLIAGGWLLNIVTTAPIISDIGDQTLTEDTASTVNFTIGDGDTAANALTVTATPSNPALLSATVSGTGNTRVLTLTPAANANGPAGTVTLTVGDNTAFTDSTTFNVTIVGVDDAPSATGLKDITTPVNVPSLTDFTIADVDSNTVDVSASIADPSVGSVAIQGTGANRTLVFTPGSVFPSSSVITVTLNDGQLTTTIPVNVSVIAPIGPTIGAIDPQSGLEDQPLDVAFTITAASANPVVVASNSNHDLISSITVTSSATAGVAHIVLVPNASGDATVTLTVTDDFGSAATSFALHVDPTPDAPVLGPIADTVANEDQGPTIALDVTDVDTALPDLFFFGTASNPALVSGVSFNNTDTGATATIHLVPNQTGVSAIRITVQDKDGGSSTQTFALQVLPVNDAPVIAVIPDMTTQEDTSLTFNMDVSDVDSDFSSLTFEGSSSDSSLVSSITFAPGTTNVAVTIHLVPNASGNAIVSITAKDATASSATSFNLTVEPVDDAPILAQIPDQVTHEDVPLSVALNLTDVDTALDALKLTATASNEAVVSGVTFAIVDNAVVATVNLVPEASGSSAITINAADSASSVSQTFNLVVVPVDDAPALAVIADQVTEEDVAVSVTVPVSDIDTAISDLTFTGSSSNSALVDSVSFDVTGSVVTATIHLVPNASGNAIVTITAKDAANTASTSFNLSVEPVDDAPVFPAIADQTTAENAALSLKLGITDVDTALADLTLSGTSTNDQLVSGITFAVVDNDLVATINLVPDATGDATVTLTASDAKNTVAQSFKLTVTAVNGAPVLGAIPDQTTTANKPVSFTVPVTDANTPLNELTLTGSSSDKSLVSGITFAVSGGVVTATITPATDATGFAIITITAADDSKSSSTSFILDVEPNTGGTTPVVTTSHSGNTLTLGLTGEKNGQLFIESSSDLKTWTLFKTVTLDANGAGSVNIDTSATPGLFFRIHN